MNSVVHRANRIVVRARKYLLFVLICIIVALVFLRIVFVIEDGWGHDAFIRWGGLSGFTLATFGLFIGDSQKFLRMQRFWVLVAVLLVGHLAIFAMVLTHVEEWKLSWFMVMVIEYPFFIVLRHKLVNVPRPE